jgi:addiction module HigA family antidote
MAVKNPKPMHPGRVLAEVYMVEMGLNQTQLADRIGCAHRKVNEIINGKRGVTADFALDLERVLGTTAEIWVTMQAAYDLGLARRQKRTA